MNMILQVVVFYGCIFTTIVFLFFFQWFTFLDAFIVPRPAIRITDYLFNPNKKKEEAKSFFIPFIYNE